MFVCTLAAGVPQGNGSVSWQHADLTSGTGSHSVPSTARPTLRTHACTHALIITHAGFDANK